MEVCFEPPFMTTLLRFYIALVRICGSHFWNKSISSEAVGTHFIYSSDQRLDQTIHTTTGQRFDVSLLNWSLPGNEWHESWVNQSSLAWEAPQWLKAGNVSQVLPTLGNLSLSMKTAPCWNMPIQLSVWEQIFTSLLSTCESGNDTSTLLVFYNPKSLFSPLRFWKLQDDLAI